MRLYGWRWDSPEHLHPAWDHGGQHGEEEGARTVGLLSAMVDALPGKLSELLEQEYALLLGDNRDVVRFLQDKLQRMNAMILHYECLDTPEGVQTRDRVRTLTYDIEDWVDLFPLRVHAAGGGRKPSSYRLLRCLPRFAHKHTRLPAIADELQDIKVRALELSEHWERYNMLWRAHPSSHRAIDLSFFDPGDLVGLDGPIEEVANMVMDAGDKVQLKIVSIVGMAGSGKTTLADAVYKWLEGQNLFQCQAFMSLGHNPDLGETLMDTLLKLTSGHHVDEDIDDPITKLKEILEKKRYLIVVDGLWSTGDWHRIGRCFPKNSPGSRIIITTRNVALAMQCSFPAGCIYNIGLLSENDSRKLILNRAFGTGHDYPQDLEDVLAKITTRCGGLPLAIITLASIIANHQTSTDEWERLIGSSWLSLPDAEVMKLILNLSYNDLPPHLRSCLMYLSTFAWNDEVDVEWIVKRWVAEGFISFAHDPLISEEETAIRYLDDLISRNMLQPLLLNKNGIRCCRLHPVIHDFIVCKSIEENFVTLMDPQNSDIPVRRLSLQSSRKQDQNMAPNNPLNLSRARSIIVIGHASTVPPLIDLRVVCVLDLEGYDGMVCLDGLDKLLLLRYLGLRSTNVSELPETLGELRYLQTLDVRSTKVKELPGSIVRLQHTLMALLFSGEGMINSIETTTRIPKDIWQLRRLENLATVDLREEQASFVKGLGALNRLRVITITWSGHQCTDGAYCEALLLCIQKWRNLKYLTVHCGLGCSMEFLGSLSSPPKQLEKFKVTVGIFVYVPPWINRLVSLSFLQITICKIGRDDLKILRDLPKLQILILGLDFVPREAIVIESEGFSELWRFSINCPVPWLTFRTGAMPNLTHLQLEICSGSARQESVPYGIGYLQRLREVALLYNQKWCDNSSGVKRTVEAVKRQVAKHHNSITLIINDMKVEVVQDEETESITEIQSGDVQVQQVGEETVRTTIQPWGETEIEVVGDNTNDA